MFSVTGIQREVHTAIQFTELCSINIKIKNCVSFSTYNSLSENYPKKYGLTDRSLNRIRTFPEVPIFFTPIYTSSPISPSHFPKVHRYLSPAPPPSSYAILLPVPFRQQARNVVPAPSLLPWPSQSHHSAGRWRRYRSQPADAARGKPDPARAARQQRQEAEQAGRPPDRLKQT